MSNKNYVIAIVISFLIAGFCLLSGPAESGVPPNGDMGCCQLSDGTCVGDVIVGGDCSEFVPPGGVFNPGETCNFTTGECVSTPPTFGCCSTAVTPEVTVEECMSFDFQCAADGGTFCIEVDLSCSAAGQACTCPLQPPTPTPTSTPTTNPTPTPMGTSLPTPTSTFAPPNGPGQEKGDANQDGMVTSADITCVILGIFEMPCPMPDCNEDGMVTSADITCVILAIFGQ